MARPRKFTDGDIHAATLRVMQRLGPGELRLKDIADEAGVTASALVQRFGSKRELLLSVSRAWGASAPELFRSLRAAQPGPLETLRAYAGCLAGLAASPAAFARSLAYLQIDLADEDFRAPLERYGLAAREQIEHLVSEARDMGALDSRVRPERLARVIETTLSGSLMTWAHYQQGPAAEWLVRDLEDALDPYVSHGRATSEGGTPMEDPVSPGPP